jgi:hypothetical protein
MVKKLSLRTQDVEKIRCNNFKIKDFESFKYL